MSAGEGGENPTPQSETDQKRSESSPKSEFRPGLVKTEDQLNELKGGKLGTTGKKIAMLHLTGGMEALSREQLAQRVAEWGDEAFKEGDEVWPEVAPYIRQMSDRVREMDQGSQKSPKAGAKANPIDEAYPGAASLARDARIAVEAAILTKGVEAVFKGGRRLVGRVAGLGRNPPRHTSSASRAGSGSGAGGNEPPSDGGKGDGGAEQEPSNEGDSFSKMNYAELESAEKRSNLTANEKARIEEEKKKLIEGLIKFDGGNFLDRVSRSVKNIVRENEWDDVYDKLTEFADNEEGLFKRTSDDDPRWQGLLKSAIYAEAANLSIQGILNERLKNPDKVNSKWLEDHDYSEILRQRLEEDSKKRIEVLGLLPANPAELVGKKLVKVDPAYRKNAEDGPDTADQETLRDEMNRMLRERMRGATQIPPKEIVALFTQGRYGNFKDEWEGKVEFLDVTKEDDRKRWILLNMAVFNDGTIPTPAMRWVQVLETWLGDLKDAGRLAKVDRETQKAIDESYKDMVAVMAISASARALEDSEGDPSRYGKVLSGSGEKPDLGIQDRMGTWLLHNDPDKLNRVLKRFDLIGRFYKRTLDDAGITAKEWSGGSPSRVTLRSITNQNIAGDVLAFYLEKGNGGFDGYIDFLLNKPKGMGGDRYLGAAKDSGVTDREISSMAKIATDIFLVDKFSRWAYLMNTKGWNTQLKPVEDYGGDPLRVILEPAFLFDKIKKVYQNSPVVDLINSAFRPTDIFEAHDLPNLPQLNKDELKNAELVASMATHFKYYMRFAEAVGNVVGSSQAAGIGDWSDRSFEALASVPELLNQVYGGIKLSVIDEMGRVIYRQRDENNPDRTGKEIVGAMVARVILAKAQALAEKATEPSFWETVGRTVTQPDDRDPFEKILQTLWGPNKDGRGGFLYEEASTRLELIMDERNRFGAAEDLAEAKRILQTRSKTPAGQSKAGLMAAGRLAVQMLASANDLRGRK